MLGSFSNTTTVDVDGIALPAGIYNTTVINSLICDGARVSHTVVLSRCVVGCCAAVVGCGVVRMKGKESSFANGQTVAVAVETGGREVMLRADMTLEDAAIVAGNRSDVSTISAWDETSTNFARRVTSTMTLLSSRCVLLNCPKIEDSFVGAGALIENSSLVGSSVLSSDDATNDPYATTLIVGGCYVEHSIVSCRPRTFFSSSFFFFFFLHFLSILSFFHSFILSFFLSFIHSFLSFLFLFLCLCLSNTPCASPSLYAFSLLTFPQFFDRFNGVVCASPCQLFLTHSCAQHRTLNDMENFLIQF